MGGGSGNVNIEQVLEHAAAPSRIGQYLSATSAHAAFDTIFHTIETLAEEEGTTEVTFRRHGAVGQDLRYSLRVYRTSCSVASATELEQFVRAGADGPADNYFVTAPLALPAVQQEYRLGVPVQDYRRRDMTVAADGVEIVHRGGSLFNHKKPPNGLQLRLEFSAESDDSAVPVERVDSALRTAAEACPSPVQYTVRRSYMDAVDRCVL